MNFQILLSTGNFGQSRRSAASLSVRRYPKRNAFVCRRAPGFFAPGTFAPGIFAWNFFNSRRIVSGSFATSVAKIRRFGNLKFFFNSRRFVSGLKLQTLKTFKVLQLQTSVAKIRRFGNLKFLFFKSN